MKKTIICIMLMVSVNIIATSCKNINQKRHIANSNPQYGSNTQLKWRDTTIDLGSVMRDSIYQVQFEFQNTGEVPLIFEKAESTCGCTVVKNITSDNFLPGKGGAVAATFNTANLEGIVTRKIYVLANTKQQFYVLRINAQVH